MINKALYQQIKHLLHKQLQQPLQPISIGKGLHHFLEEWSIGYLVNSSKPSATLNSEHCQRLRALVISSIGCDPLTDNLPHTRLAMAKTSKEEKTAGNLVFSLYLQVASRGPIHLINGQAQTAPGTLLSLFDNAIDWSKYNNVIIVENGEASINWHLAKLPSHLDQALFVYRGHGINEQIFNRILNEVKHIQRIGFYDVDPSGLELAHQANTDEILVPKGWNTPTEPDSITIDSQPNLVQSSNKQRFFTQYDKAIPYLNKTSISQLPFFKWLVEHQISLSQEFILTNQLPLERLKLKTHC
jgi:hypothetical protein